MIDSRFIILAIILDIIGSAGYIIDTIKGRTKPNRVSWFLWTLISVIIFCAMLAEKASFNSLIFTFTLIIGPLAIFLLSFVNKNAVWQIKTFDWVCGGLSVVGLIAWLLTSDGNPAIVLSIVADFFALLPTLVKAVKAPETESWLLYFNGAVGALITILTLKHYDFASIVYPIYLLTVCLGMFILIKFKIGEKFHLSENRV